MQPTPKPTQSSPPPFTLTPLQRKLIARIAKLLKAERRPYPLSLYLKIGTLLLPKIKRPHYFGGRFIEGLASRLDHWGHRRLRLCVAIAGHPAVSSSLEFYEK